MTIYVIYVKGWLEALRCFNVIKYFWSYIDQMSMQIFWLDIPLRELSNDICHLTKLSRIQEKTWFKVYLCTKRVKPQIC